MYILKKSHSPSHPRHQDRGQKSAALSFLLDREIHPVYYQPVTAWGSLRANLSPEKSSDFWVQSYSFFSVSPTKEINFFEENSVSFLPHFSPLFYLPENDHFTAFTFFIPPQQALTSPLFIRAHTQKGCYEWHL